MAKRELVIESFAVEVEDAKVTIGNIKISSDMDIEEMKVAMAGSKDAMEAMIGHIKVLVDAKTNSGIEELMSQLADMGMGNEDEK